MNESPYIAAQRFSPRTSRLRRFWKKLTSKQKQRRFEEAQRREGVVLQVRELIATGVSEAMAVTQIRPPVHRSTYRHWEYQYNLDGLEGLVNRQVPPPQEAIPENIKQIVCTLRQADPNFGVTEIVSFVHQHHNRTISATSVKRILKEAGLAWEPGRPSQRAAQPYGQRLHLGGMKLLEGAAMSTGYLEQLTTAVVEHVSALSKPEQAQGPDVAERDEQGRFLSSYNERYRKKEGDAVGPGFLSVALKREFKDPTLLHVSRSSPAVVERKLWALMCSPVIGSGNWDGMRTTRGKLLGELCGYEYMPSTLELFTGELKYAGVADSLWETHARVWHTQTQDWGVPRHAAVLYVDGTTKPIWTQLFSQSTHVSLLNRTMPGLDVVAFHNGYGVPLWYLGHSGRAPLVKVVPEAIAKLEQHLGDVVARIVIIDAEGNSVPFLGGLEKNNRGWVTRLRPSMLQGKDIINWSSYRPYRNSERIREGEVELSGGDQEKLRVRLIEIRRERTDDVLYFAASKLLRAQDWKTAEVADLYYDRWPNQEANFRAVNQAADLKQVHGYGKQLVENVAVTTQLEELRQRTTRLRERYTAQLASIQHLEQKLQTEQHAIQELRLRKGIIDTTVVSLLKRKKDNARNKLRALHEERKHVEAQIDSRGIKTEKLRAKHLKSSAMAERTQQKLMTYVDDSDRLASMTRILSHDVELDSIFNVLKVGLTMLVTYVLTKLLGKARLDPTKFLEHIGTLPARQHFKGKYEYITFEYNIRDPNIMALLISQCDAINTMNLPMRSGRILRIAVDEPPSTSHPDKDERTASSS